MPKQPKTPGKTAQLLLLIVAIGYGLYGSFTSFLGTFSIYSYDAGNRRFEERLKNMRELIPFTRGVIGYFSNEHVGFMEADLDNANGEYVLTQYALAPLILDPGVYHEWNILNLSSEVYETWNSEHGDEFKTISSAGGFYLIQRLSP